MRLAQIEEQRGQHPEAPVIVVDEGGLDQPGEGPSGMGRETELPVNS